MEVESMKSKKPSPLERRPSLLKDFLRDDMSSCSSNGFRSFPRRSCYTSIRNLLEIDLKTRDIEKQQLQRSRSKAATTTTISAFQKASDAVINVVKHLTFSSSSSVKSPLSSSSKQGILILPRSFSRRLRRSFWRSKSSSSSSTHEHHKVVELKMNAAIKVKDIMRWRSFRDLVEEKHKSLEYSSSSPIHTIVNATTTTTSSSSSTATTISWSDSDFTSESLHSSSGSSESSCENEDVVQLYLPEKKKKCSSSSSSSVGEEDSNSIQVKGEALMYDKDHFSPVSVLDFPCEEEEEEEDEDSSSSSFQSSIDSMEKKKHKLMQKIRRFESLTQLEPVNLDKRISSFEQDHDSLGSPSEDYSVSVGDNIVEEYDEEEEDIEAEEKARKLLDLVKETVEEESFESNEDIVLIDFFRDEILERNLIKRLAKRDDDRLDHGLLNVARDWINGYCEQLDWGLEESRKVHVKDMERGGNWRDSDNEEEQGVLALEMEVMVFDLLMDDLLLDLSA